MFLNSELGFIFLLVSGLSSSAGCRFQPLTQYTYLYQATSVVHGVSSAPSFDLSCTVAVTTAESACHAQFQVAGCELKQFNGKAETEVKDADAFIRDISRYPVLVKYKEATKNATETVELFASPSESVNILNLKRGIVSAFQFPSLSQMQHANNDNRSHVTQAVQDDILGSCPTQVIAALQSDGNVTKWRIETSRDLVVCDLSYASKVQQSYLSFIQVMMGGERRGPITELSYAHESKITCSYMLSSTKEVETVNCQQTQALDPGRDIPKRELAHINQILELISKTKNPPGPIPSEVPLVKTDIAMDMTSEANGAMDDDVHDNILGDGTHDAHDVEKVLQKAIQDFLSQGEYDDSDNLQGHLTSISFRRLVILMRRMNLLDLSVLSEAAISCRDHPLCDAPFDHLSHTDDLQSIRERLLIKALMACGNEPCMHVFTDQWLTAHRLPAMMEEAVMVNMGLFYTPTPAIAESLRNYCAKKESPRCWLSLSAMLQRLFNEESERQEIHVLIYNTVENLMEMMGDTCKPNTLQNLTPQSRHAAAESLATAIKALINLGTAVHKAHDMLFDPKGEETVLRAILYCVRNDDLKLATAKDSVKALNSLELQPPVVSELVDLILEESRPVVLRAAIFDILVSQNDFQILSTALGLIGKTRMEGMQTYIMTKISSVLEDQDPQHHDLRATLRDVMQNYIFPKMGDKILSRSHVTHVSRYLSIPLTRLRAGGWLNLILIYTPESNVLHSMTLNFGILVEKTKIEIADLTIDLEGMDSLAEVLEKQGSRNGKTSQKTVDPIKIIDLLQEYIMKVTQQKSTWFSHMHTRIRSALEQLMATANLRKAVFPRASVSFGTMGYNFGWFSSDDVLKLMKQNNVKDNVVRTLSRIAMEGLHTEFLNAFRVFEDHKTLPTSAGFVLKNIIDATAVIKGSLGIHPGSHQETNRETAVVIKPSLSFAVYTDLKVKLPRYASLGLDASVLGLIQGDFSTGLRLWLSSPAGKGSFSLQLSKRVPQRTFTFLQIDADSYALQNGVKLTNGTAKKESSLKLCLPDIYTKLTAHRVCGAVARAPTSTLYSWSSNDPLRPFSLQGSLETEDRHLRQITFYVAYTPKVAKGHSIELVIKAPGTLFARDAKVTIDMDGVSGSLHVSCHIPDAEIAYTLENSKIITRTKTYRKFASILTQAGTCWNSFIYETTSDLDQNIREVSSQVGSDSTPATSHSSTHFNITLNRLLSLDINAQNKMTGLTSSITDIVFTYYCHPRLRLLYALHPITSMAAAEGHRSRFSLHQEKFDSMTSFEETRRAFHKVTILLPGKNLTTITTIRADLEGADRNSDLYWTTGDGLDFVSTTSHVTNSSTPEQFHFDYILNATRNDESDLTLEGHVFGPRGNPFADLDIRADISYSLRKHRSKRSKRSLVSMVETLESMEKTIEEEAVSLFKTVKSSLSNMLGSDENATEISNEEIVEKADKVRLEEPKLTAEAPMQRQSFWDLPHWTIGLDAKISMRPRKEPTVAGVDVMGPQVYWNITAEMPRGNGALFQINGTAFQGGDPSLTGTAYTTWIRSHFWDQIHHLSMDIWVDQRKNPMEFLHQHNWTLVETDRHSFDRSFLTRLHLESRDPISERYEHFSSEVYLASPRTNLSHKIDYNLNSSSNQTVRVFALLHNTRPPFDIAYVERSDFIDGNLDTHINLTSSFLDYQIDVVGKSALGGSNTLEGRLRVDSRIPSFPGERTFSTSVTMSKPFLPVCTWVYIDQLGGEIKGNISLLEPTIISVNAEANDKRIWYTIELMEPTLVKHSLTLSPAMLAHVTAMVSTASQSSHPRTRLVGHVASTMSQNVLLDPKDYRLPFSNTNLQKSLMAGVQKAQMSNNTRKAKLYKLGLGLLGVVNELYTESPVVKIVRALHLDRVIAAQLRSMSSSAMSKRKSHPSSFVRQFFKVYGYRSAPMSHHTRESEMANEEGVALGSRTFSFYSPLPFVMTAFNRPPRLTIAEKEILAMLKRVSTGTERRTKHFAVIMQGWNINTFDGKNLHLTAPKKDSCTYLLGGDLRHGRFALTYTSSALTVSTRQASLTLHRDGAVLASGRDVLQDLPYTTTDGLVTVELHDSHLHVSIDGGKADLTFCPNDDYFVVEIDRRLNNASLGLLGTNNNEKGDELRLPEGGLAQDFGTFQNSYELSGHEDCKVTTLPPQGLCQGFDVSRRSPCMSLSDQWRPAIPCLLVVDPGPFILQCQVMECDGQSGCPAVAAYLDTCRYYGIQVGTPPACVLDGCVKNKPMTIDLVIVYSLQHALVSSHGSLHHPLTWAKLLVKGLAHSLDTLDVSNRVDARVGLVTFGGQGKWEKARAILMQGKLLQTPKETYRDILADVQPGIKEYNASSAILMASDFPFRKNTAKIIFLVHEGQSPGTTKSDNSKLLKTLQSRNVVLVAAAPYARFEDQGPIGLWANGELILTGSPSSHPMDPYNDVVRATGGFWLDWNALRRMYHYSRTKSRGFQSRNNIEAVVANFIRLGTKIQTQRCQG